MHGRVKIHEDSVKSMYRILTFITIACAAGWFSYALRAEKGKIKGSVKVLLSGSKESFIKFRHPRSLHASDILACLKTLSYFLSVLSVLILSLSGFLQYLITGSPLSGFILVLHVSIAPVFSICMTVVTLLWAQEQIFDKNDRQWFFQIVLNTRNKKNVLPFSTALKMCFWMLILLTPFVMGSIILSMYSVFGTAGQRSLLDMHFISAFLFLIISIFHTYFLLNFQVPEAKNE